MNLPLVRCGVLALWCLACSSSFNPFPQGDAGTDNPGDDAPTLDAPRDTPYVCPPLRCETDIRQWFTDRCGSSTCHGGEVSYAGGNYETGDVYGRLVGLPSGGQGGYEDQCGHIPVIDPVNPQNSMLYRKLRNTQGDCGDRMPFDGLATSAELGCVESWIEREACLRAGDDAGPRSDAGPTDAGPGPMRDARPPPPSETDPSRDPRPLTFEEAECLNITNPACVGCHQIDEEYYGTPYWAPGHSDPDLPVLEDCDVPPNRLNDEALECFGLGDAPCAVCHTAGDGNIYLRPWNGTSSPPMMIDPACYELL